MKKQILVLAALFAGSASIAQVTTLKNKKGFEILPQKGDYAISIDATPILDFGVNVLKMGANGIQNADSTFTGVNNTRVVGKYFLENNMAVRAVVGINSSTTSSTAFTDKIGGTPEDEKLETKTIRKQTQINLGGGLEWRRGHNRLQGFYGAELSFQIGSPKTHVSEELSMDLSADLATDYGVTSFYTEKGSAFGFGLRGFAGVEYFVLPKISLGGEAGFALNYFGGSSTRTVSTWNGTEVVETEPSAFNGKQGSFTLGNAYSVNMMITFHF